MYNNSYEEYMRTVLGYMPNCLEDTYNTNDYYINRMNEGNLDDLYPDMYKKVYPLVCNECNSVNMPITQEILESMTDNVFRQIEIDLKLQTNAKQENRKEENRAVANNNVLRDLIKILILRELTDRGRVPNRPPFPPNRPPMPGTRPPFPGNNRPPFPPPGMMMQRDY